MFVDEKAAGEAKTAEQANRKLKLSEAIRESMNLFPKQGALWQPESACVLCGVAYTFGYDRDRDGYPWEFLERRWPVLNTGYGLHDLRTEIEGRNVSRHSVGGENREQIADWLESLGY